MIAASHQVSYIHEPFQVERLFVGNAPRFDLWFTYVCDENSAQWRDELQEQLSLRFRPSREIGTIQRPRQAASFISRWARSVSHRLQRRRALMKDPIALFSADWLARTFDMDVVVLIRHPAAFAGSLKAAAWSHPFAHFSNQPLLMEHHLAPFRAQIEQFTRRPQGIIDQAVLLWNLTHFMVLKYRQSHPEWLFVRHEDLSLSPVSGFKDIFEHLDLPFTRAVESAIRTSSETKNPNPGLHDTVRDSATNIHSWQKRLTEDEIRRIREGTRGVADAFYSAADWDGK